MFKIHNVRLGRATNSSSSHSIVILPPGKKSQDYHDLDSRFAYGWEWFRLGTKQSKMDYIATQFLTNMTEENFDRFAAAELIKQFFGVDMIDELGNEKDKFGGPYVDHQSVISLPNKNDLTKEFADELMKFIQDDRVLILGGNDNDEASSDFRPSDSSLPEVFTKLTHDDPSRRKYIRLRRDGENWIFYDGKTGNKIRFTFDIENQMNPKPYEKASTPELVDVKITNWCNAGCHFCYQSSTKEGKHASLEDIKNILAKLNEMVVFEVAYGGGSPVDHPDFIEILRTTKDDYNITPNFTTFSVSWIKNEKIVEAVKKYCGGVGVSVHSVKELNKVEKVAEALNGKDPFNGYYWRGGTKVMAQHVVGTLNVSETIKLITEAFEKKIPILLLGYKDVGFGKTFQPHDMSGLELMLKLSIEKNRDTAQMSIDTAIVNNFPNLTKILNVSDVLVTSKEGAFSCYIDAVDKKIAPSSYVEKEQMIDLPDNTENIKNIFTSF